MTILKRSYIVPLRRGFVRTERYRRAKKAVRTLREFMMQHMKAQDVKIGPVLNEELWAYGAKNPPAKVSVVCEKDEEGIVYVELEGSPLPSELVKVDNEKSSE